MNKIESVCVNYNLDVPSYVQYTTIGNNECVYVKYDDFSFYPEYVVYYYEYKEKVYTLKIYPIKWYKTHF